MNQRTGIAAFSVQPQRTLSWRRRQAVVIGTVGMALIAAACNGGGLPTPSRDAAQGQTMLDLAQALSQMRDQSAGLQDQVDSLRDVVMRQDTIIRQLAATAGITMKPPQ